MTDRMVDGVLQPDGHKMPEPRMDAKAVGDAVAYMASLPLDANDAQGAHCACWCCDTNVCFARGELFEDLTSPSLPSALNQAQDDARQRRLPAAKARDHSLHDALRIHFLQRQGMSRPLSQ